MCSPEVMAKVREELSRRRLLGATGAVVAAAALSGIHTAHADNHATPMAGDDHDHDHEDEGHEGEGQGHHLDFSKVVDLTHTWGPGFPVFPGSLEPTIETLVTVEADGYYIQKLTLAEHTGTHMDAPAHFIADGAFAGDLDPATLVAPLVVIDISAKTAEDPDSEGTIADIEAWEAEHGEIPAGAFVALHSGWAAKLADPVAYVNLDEANVQHYPGWNPEAATFLVEQRDIVGAGVDTLSLDFGASTTFAAHVTLLGAGKYGIENLANLDQVPDHGAMIVVGGPKHEHASGGPTRALALLP